MAAFQTYTQVRCTLCNGQAVFNPHLCTECQVWNDAAHLFTHQPFQQAGGVAGKSPSEFHDLEFFRQNPDCLVCNQMAEVILGLPKYGDFGVGDGTDIRIAIRSAHIVQSLGSGFSYDWFGWGVRYLSKIYRNSYRVHCGLLVDVEYHNPSVREDGDSHLSLDSVGKARNKRRVVLEFAISYDQAWYNLSGLSPWDRSYFSVPMVKSWIRESGSQIDRSVASRIAKDFRVVDTLEGRIIKVSSMVRYVALSYVWGNSEVDRGRFQLMRNSIHDVERQGKLWDLNLPPIISDAIRLCIDLGERYLWVDRICIVQDDPKSKHSQITAMDTIYQNATFTIVALADPIYSIGLPGVSSRPRPKYPLNNSVVEKKQLVSDIAALIENSRWNSRGWTFQEQVLSERQLYISETCIFLVIKGELIVQEPLDPTYPELRPSRLIGGIYLDVGEALRKEDLQIYKTSVETYKLRHLSFNSDALNAFAGVGTRLAMRMKTSLLFGLPERYFLRALLWRHTNQMKAEDADLKFPTWSWAGWEGAINYRPMAPYSLESVDAIGSLVKFYFVDPEKGIRPVGEEEHFFSGVGLGGLAHNDRLLRYEGNLRHMMLSQLDDVGDRAVATWRECGHNPWDALVYRNLSQNDRLRAAQNLECLVFNSTIASFYVRTPRQTDITGSEVASRRFMTRLEIVDDADKVVGTTAEVDIEWINQNIDIASKQEFVVIGGVTSRNGFDGLQAFKEPIPAVEKNKVLIKIRSVSLNYRDVAIANSKYPLPVKDQVVPCSDMAGEVVQVGEYVDGFSIGDSVISILSSTYLYGVTVPTDTLGGPKDGVLKEYISLPAHTLIKLPKSSHSFAQWASVVCTGSTVWNSFYGNMPLKPGDSVLVLGTGGVSMTAVVFAKAAGATTIVTSSSDQKLEYVKSKLGADHTINYKKHPNWAAEVLRITNGRGVDHIIETTGSGTIQQSLECIADGGIISVIGFLAPITQDKMPNVAMLALFKGCCVRGILGGSKQQLEEMTRLLASTETTLLQP
ncbi:hypothetical protein F4677DRAFT_465767 [Hypoxylon crocopeplum]|nr:hypothetical protein F4677DRAFT_465767 [Hypoxylon crocopeplum]